MDERKKTYIEIESIPCYDLEGRIEDALNILRKFPPDYVIALEEYDWGGGEFQVSKEEIESLEDFNKRIEDEEKAKEEKIKKERLKRYEHYLALKEEFGG